MRMFSLSRTDSDLFVLDLLDIPVGIIFHPCNGDYQVGSSYLDIAILSCLATDVDFLEFGCICNDMSKYLTILKLIPVALSEIELFERVKLGGLFKDVEDLERSLAAHIVAPSYAELLEVI